MRGFLITMLIAAAGCGRTEEPPGLRARDARVTVTSAEPGPASPPQGTDLPQRSDRPCVVPMAKEPPPAARPAEACPSDPVSVPPYLPTGTVTFPDAPQKPTVSVEVAASAQVRERGLMYRTHLGRDAGMLFVWPKAQPRRFWMHNTCIPLDMMFIAPDDTIACILEQVPTLNDAPRQCRCPASRVLEVNAGWSRAHGVRPGQKVQVQRHRPAKGAPP